ncbi:hypothetical protein GGI35DRAFT_492450 [Trichoderma velutinum]
MPPKIILRSHPVKMGWPSSPYPDSSDENPSIPSSSTKNTMKQPQPKDDKIALREGDTLDEEQETLAMGLKRKEAAASQKSLSEGATTSGSQKFVSSEAEASNPYSGRYPVSHRVFDLEKRAQELQDKRDFFQNQCHELTLIVERLNKATKKERTDHEAKCASLKVANDDMAKQLEKEKDKVKELQSTNESLVRVLAAASEEKSVLNKMLEEKTYESWIFRCALAVVYKATPSSRERVSMRKLICDCFAALHQKYQQERTLQQEDQTPDQNSSDRDSDAGDLYSDSEDMPLRKKKAQKKRPRVKEERDDRVSNDDSDDDDQPLFHVLKKRAKKLKIMPSREKSSSFD